jgi:hypothetical protein
MMTSLPTDSIQLLQIRKSVESRLGSVPDSPADFAELSLHVKMATGKEISADTLSRIWGYKKGYHTVRRSVVEILEEYGRADSESDFLYDVVVKADETPVGGRVRIAWLPDRVCVLEYKGGYRWEIKEISNSKLHAGDSFSCRVLAQGQALIVDNLQSGGQHIVGYTIGGRNGLTVVRRES